MRLYLSLTLTFLASTFSSPAQSVSEAMSSKEVTVLGYTEPYRSIEMTSPEADLIAKIFVEEGQEVKAGDAVLSLDNSVLEANLKTAKIQAGSEAQIAVAQADVTLAQDRFDAYEVLKKRGTATPDEVARATANLSSAENKLTLAKEAKTIAELEVKQIEAQIKRRVLSSPIDGVILEVNRDETESSIGRTDDFVLVQVAQMEQLRLVVHIPAGAIGSLQEGDELPVRILFGSSLTKGRESEGIETTGKIEFISPAIDPSSETIKTRLVIDNSKRNLRSGAHALVTIPSAKAKK